MTSTPAQRHYNPDWLSDDDLVANFVARRELFEFLRDELARAPRQGSVQHYLLVGPRGSGKTTLLKRLAVAIRRDADLQDHLIALSFPEELYQVKHLADFWWAACEALLDELDRLGNSAAAGRLEPETARPRGAAADPLSDAGLKLLLETCAALQRRPVLLVDNLDFVFQRIDKQGRRRKDPHAPAYWALREALSTATAPIVVGGSVRLSEPFTDYDKAFYDFFLPKRLGKLGLDEVRRVLEHLAESQAAPEVKDRLRERPSRIEALYELTGGNPRALGLIFELLRQGPSSRAVEDFERLMDLTTPYYKARFEDLAEQAQVVMHALAVHRPGDGGSLRFGHTAAELGDRAGLPTNTVSAQLDVLEREGLVEKSAAKGRVQYRVAEQLFRLWLQMRGSRRIRQQVIGLTEFLEALFDLQELQAHFRAHGGGDLAEARLSFALAGARYELPLRRGLEAYGTDRLLQHARTQGENLEDYLPAGDLPEDLEKLVGLRQRLGSCRFHGLDVAEQEALLGSVRLKPEDKEASVEKLCQRSTAQAEADRLRPLLAAERQRLLRLGLTGPDVDLLFHKRVRGLLPLPELTPADVDADPTVDAGLRAMVWRLVGARELVKFSGEQAARDWLDWGLRHAGAANSTEWANVAGSLRLAQRFDEAKRALEDAFERGESARAWHERGAWLASTNGNFAKVEAAFRRAIELDPAYASPWIGLGNLLAHKLNRYEEAEAAYRRAIELDPAHALPWIGLGLLLAHKLNRYEEAEAAYRRAIELDPAHALPWIGLGQLLAHKLNRYEDAEVAYLRAIELDPVHAFPWNKLGILLANKLNRYEEAEAAFRRAIELDPAFARPWNNLGNLLADKLNRHKEAEAAFRRAIELDPAFAWPWNNLGDLLADKLNRQQEAEAAYWRAIELDPADAWPWNNLGLLLAWQPGRYDEAEAAFAKAAELEPNTHPYWQAQRLNLQTSRVTTAAQEALTRHDPPALQAALEKLLAESLNLADALASAAFVEGFLAPALASGQGGEVLACLQALGYDKHARPLLLALEAAVQRQPGKLDDVEPEVQRAAKLIYGRLQTGMED